jgi:hypothetical protein
MAEAGAGGTEAGIEMADTLLGEVEGEVAGTYLMPSFGRYEQAAELVRRIRDHKQSLGLDFVDRTQEASNLARLEEVNSGPLTSDGLGRLYRELLELTKSETER